MHFRRIAAVLATTALGAAASLGAGPAAAQAPDTLRGAPADTFRLDDIVVTAARLPIRLADAPGAVTVISGEQLRERGVRYVAEALRTVPGAAVVQSSGPGALTSLFIRGGESDYVQVLVDGIQVNDPGGAFDWAHLRAEDIDRIEVVRGPASVLYGSDAVSGVVQIFTRAGGAPRVEVAASSGVGDKRGEDADGTYRTTALDVSLAGATALHRDARLEYGVNGAHHRSNGLHAFNNEYDNTTLSARLHLLARGFDAAVTARGSDNRYHYPTSGSGAVIDTNQFSTGETRSIGVDAGYRFAEFLELRVLGTSHGFETRTENPPEPGMADVYHATGEQTRRKLDGRLNAQLAGVGVATLGVEREWQASATAYESVSEWGTFAEETDESRRNTGWYAQLHATPLRGVAATLGGRIDDNEAFGTFRTARAALNVSPLPGLRLHTAWGTAFKEPTFFETFATGYTRGNPGLQPERSRSVEAGAEQALLAGRVTLGATWFDQRFRNLIQYTFSPPQPEAPNYYNIGAARARGAELSARAALGDVTATAQYTYTSTRVTDAGFGSDAAFQQDRRLLRRPRHVASLATSYRIAPSLRALLDVRHTGTRDDLDFTDPDAWDGLRVELPAFTTVDAGAEIGLLRRGADVDLTLRVRNLFDARYQEIYNFPAAGRVLQLGLRAGRGL